MKKRQEGESQFDWNMRQVDRNLNQVEWMFKWLLIPMWLLLFILWIVRFTIGK
jgi:hypothetical protein